MNRVRKAIVSTALIGTTIAGGAIGSGLVSSVASAADNTTTVAAATAPADATQAPKDPSVGGHVGKNGTKEVVLTGDTATKVKEAALAAEPGGTVQRVENDAEGATYEAHMTKADGTQITVKLDANFKVTSIEDGMR